MGASPEVEFAGKEPLRKLEGVDGKAHNIISSPFNKYHHALVEGKEVVLCVCLIGKP